MSRPAKKILADALRLNTSNRAEIAAELLASLDGPADPDSGSAWEAEIQRRVAEIESGGAKLEPWDKVRRRIAQRLRRGR